MKKLLAKKKVGRVGTAHFKITAVLIYYTVLGVVGLSTATSSFTTYSTSANIVEYLACESRGMADCVFNSTFHTSTLAIVVVVLFSFLPVVAILFSCDPRTCRRKPKSSQVLQKKSSTLLELMASGSHGKAAKRDCDQTEHASNTVANIDNE